MIPYGTYLGASSPSSSEAPSGVSPACHAAPRAATIAPPVVAAPLGAPSGITAPQTGSGSREPVPVEFQCAVGSCRSPQGNWHTGFCDAHHERFMDRVYDMTHDVGRGQL